MMKSVLAMMVALMLCLPAQAEYLQILHTNDIHSYFDHTDHEPDRGGFANLKAVMDQQEAIAYEQGVDTLRVDAGDFMEGTIFYMAEYGRKSFDMHNMMGYDVAVIGNHDYLMGTDDLNSIVGDVNPDFAYLGANVKVDSRFKHIRKHMVPYKMINHKGIKIAFLGLTTNDLLYSWRLYDGVIEKPIKVAKKWAKKLKNEMGADVVIAVTHIGFGKDKKLAKKVPEIDLIIGGHSHDALFAPHWQKSKKGKKVPIVQAGHHAEYLGKLLLDVSKDGLKIVDYELLPVHAQENPDQDVADFVADSLENIKSIYGEEHLEHFVAQSYISPENEEGKTMWSHFTADAMREAVDCQISIQQENMSGPNFPVGEINRFKIYQAHPRWFDFSDRDGWHVYRARVNGFVLRAVFKAVMNLGLPLNISGITFDWWKTPWGSYWVKKMRINGKKINPFKTYTIALPEGIVRGGYGISPLVGLLLKKSHKTPITVVKAIEDKLTRERGVGDDYIEFSNQLNLKSLGNPVDRVTFNGRER